MKRGVWENGIPVFRSYLKNTSNAKLSARVLWRIADLLKMYCSSRRFVAGLLSLTCGFETTSNKNNLEMTDFSDQSGV